MQYANGLDKKSAVPCIPGEGRSAPYLSVRDQSSYDWAQPLHCRKCQSHHKWSSFITQGVM